MTSIQTTGRSILRAVAGLLALTAMTISYADTVYYDIDFEDGTPGGGHPFPDGLFGDPSVIASSHLTGNSFYLETNDQWVWDRPLPDSPRHHVSFDYFLGSGPVVFFLDAPSIARFDFDLTGTHHVDLYFDLATQSIETLVDGVLNPGYLTINAWPSSPVTSTMRFANQAAPGTQGGFEIDNLRWEGLSSVPEGAASTLPLLALGLASLVVLRRRSPGRRPGQRSSHG